MVRIARLATSLLIMTGTLAFLTGRSRQAAVRAIEPGAASVLVRFGVDGRANVDWSGSVSAPPGSTLAEWQFDSRDQLSGNSWKCSTRRETYWDTPYERNLRPTSNREKVTAKGIVLNLRDSRGEFRVKTAQGDFSFTLSPALWSTPQTFLSGAVSVSAVAPALRLTTGPEIEDYPSLLEARDGTLWVAYQTYSNNGDRIFVRRRRNGAWSEAEPVSAGGGDCFRTALAQDRAGRIWVVWAARVSSNFDLYGRAFDGRKWSAIERLTSAENSDIFHALASDASGKLYLAYQSARAGNFDIYLRVFDGQKWSGEMQVSSDPANEWNPTLAVAADGRVTILWDTYAKGNYDIMARTYENGKLGDIVAITQSGAMEARPSAQYDRQGRLWVAWDEGDWNWGKDFGYQIPESGRGLLDRRQVRVAVLENGKLLEPRGSIGASVPEDLRQVFHQPTLVLDRQDNPWVFFRTRVNLPQGKGETHRALWRVGATSYQHGAWIPMIEFSEGFGRIDAPGAAVLQRDGNIGLVWASDGRLWPAGFPREQDLYFASLPSAPEAARVELTAFQPPSDSAPTSHPEEERDVQRARSYRATVGGQTLRIVRGDIHRHTDISWDGNRDGSLIDSYRYAMDAASFDYVGVCDHQNGKESRYDWRLLQKAVDLFSIQGKFTPLYSYERSLPYPNGHRNVLLAERGRPLLPTSDAEQKGMEGAAKLYNYLRKFGGFTASHTSASGMGTDWRDSDPVVEPVVEIYQGYRSNYEGLGTPRAPGARESERFAPGFVWNAWAKGIKLGVQSSSDHVSTHISYACFYVDDVSREAIVRSAKARRSYAATDNIIVDLRMGSHFMGESFRLRGPLPLQVYVAGTGLIARAEVIRNNRIVYTAPGSGTETRFTYTDTDTRPGEAYYYVRIEQQNGQLAWSSPVWVQYE